MGVFLINCGGGAMGRGTAAEMAVVALCFCRSLAFQAAAGTELFRFSMCARVYDDLVPAWGQFSQACASLNLKWLKEEPMLGGKERV